MARGTTTKAAASMTGRSKSVSPSTKVPKTQTANQVYSKTSQQTGTATPVRVNPRR